MRQVLRAIVVVVLLVFIVWQPVDAEEATPPWKSYQSYWAFAQSHPVFDPTEEYSFSSADRAELKDANSSTWAAFIRLSEVQGMVIYEGLLNYLRRFEGEEPLTIDDVVYKPYVESAKNEIKDMLELVGGDTEGYVNDRARAVVSDAETVETLIDLKDVVEVLQAIVEGTAITKAGAKVLRGRAGFMELLGKAKGDAPFIAIDLAMGIVRACLEDTVNTGFVYAFRTVADEMPDGEPSSGFIKKATRELIDEYEAQRDARYEALKEETAKWIWESASGAVQTLFLVKPVTFAFDRLFGNRREAQRDALTAALVSAQMQRAAEVAYQRFRSGNSVDGERRIGDAGLVYLLAAQSANDEYAKLFRELGRVELRERAVEYERKAEQIRQALSDWVKIGESGLSNPHKAAQSTYRGSIAFKDEQGSLVPGVTIRLTGNMNATKSSADGRWSADQLTGEITVRPSKSGYEFKPESQVMTGERPALEFTGKPLQPARPTNLTAAATGSQCVELAWENPSDFTEGFEIWRKGEHDADFKRIAKLDYSNDPTLANRWDVQGDATYLYKVKAYNHGAFSDFSDVASVTTVRAPVELVAKASSPTHVDLSWVNTSGLPHSVVIERKIGDDGAWQYVDITINASSYTDTRAVSGPMNYYRLRATIDGGGVSDWTEEVGATYTYSVSGRVMNENQGVEGAVVTASGEYFSSSDTVGADGRWKIDGIQGPVAISVEKPGYTFMPRGKHNARAQDTAADIDFDSSYSLTGRAVDSSGNAIAGVRIDYRCFDLPGVSGYVPTNPDGSWSISGLSGTVSLTASKTGVTFVRSAYEVNAPSDALVFLDYGTCGAPKWGNIVAIAAGTFHIVGLRSDGTVVAVGYDTYGMCRVSKWRDIVAIAAGNHHTVGLKSDGTVLAIGQSKRGQCDVSGWRDIVAIAATSDHTVGLRSDGTVIAVGDNGHGQCNVSEWHDIVAIAAGTHHTVGLKSDGTAVAVGDRFYGLCNVSGWRDIVAIAAGFGLTVGLKRDGTVVAIGSSSYSAKPNVSGWRNIVAIAAGLAHTVGLKSDGTVVANAYYSESGQCDVSEWRNIVAIAAGYACTVGLKSDATVVAVGTNSDSLRSISGGRDIWQVAASDTHTVGLRSDGTVVAVGSNAYGQCDVSEWRDIMEIAAGEEHTVGLKSDGTVVAVGDNRHGQCDVSEWRDIVAIAAGDAHTVGLKSDGTVEAVGDNSNGRCSVYRWRDIVAIEALRDQTVGHRSDGATIRVGF